MAIDPREFDQFINNARIKLTGSSDAGLKAELFSTLKEFLADSNCWIEGIDFQATAGERDYLLVPANDGQIIRLLGIWDRHAVPIAGFLGENFQTLRLVHAPSTTPDHQWHTKVVKNVVLPITRENIPIVPTFLFRVYGEHILDGLLGRMMGQMDKSYSNSTLSTYHLRRFRTGIQIAKTATIRANTVGAQAWAYPRGWRSISQRGGVSTAWPPEGRL